MDDEKQIEKMNFKLQIISHFPEQIIKMWIVSQRNNQRLLTDCLLKKNNNITEIINLNLKYFAEKFNDNNYHHFNLWEIVKEVDKDTFNYILENNLYFNIEKCSSVTNELNYVMKLIDKGYKDIIYYIDEIVFFELIKIAKYNEIIFEQLKNDSDNQYKFLKSDKVFIYFVNEINKKVFDYNEKNRLFAIIRKKIPIGNFTKEKLVSLLLNTDLDYSAYTYLIKSIMGEEYLLNRANIDNSEIIRKILDLGYIPPKVVKIGHMNEYQTFIDYGFLDIINDVSISKSNIVPSYEIFKSALGKGYDIKNLSNLYGVSSLNLDFEKNKDNIAFKYFVCFYAIYKFHIKFINSEEDIYKYFDNNGIKESLFEKLLFNNDKDKSVTKLLLKHYSNEKKIISYIITSNKIKEKINNINSISDISEYFDDNGPNFKLLIKYIENRNSLDAMQIFNEKYPFVKRYSEYINEKNSYNSLETFACFVDEEKIELDKEILDNLLLNNFNLFRHNNTLYLQYNDEPIVQNYINFLLNNGNSINSTISNIIRTKEDIKKYFTENSVKEEFYEAFLINNYICGSFEKDILIKHYSDSKYVCNFIENGIIFKNFFDKIDGINDIKKYFTDEGITYELFKRVFDSDAFETTNLRKVIIKLLIINSYYDILLEKGTCEYAYLKFCKETSSLLGIDWVNKIVGKNIEEYFDENGPKQVFFEEIIKKYYNEYKDRFIYLFSIYKENEFSLDKKSSINQFFSFMNYNGSNYQIEYEQINKYFGENGPTKELILEFFINHNSKWSSNNKLFDYITLSTINEENIDEYFDENGMTIKFVEEILFNSNGYSLLKNIDYLFAIGYSKILSNQRMLNFIDFEKKYGFMNFMLDISIDDIYSYFDESGITDKLYEKALLDSELFLLLITFDCSTYSQSFNEIKDIYNKLCILFGVSNINSILFFNTPKRLYLLYNKKDKLLNYYKTNDEIFLTLNIEMLDDKFDNIPNNLLQIILLYSSLQDKIIEIKNDDNIDLLILLLCSVMDKNFKSSIDAMPVIYNIVNNFNKYPNIIETIKIDAIDREERIQNLIYILQSETIVFKIDNYDDLSNDTFIAKQTEYFNKVKNNINTINKLELIEAILLKKYGLNLEKASFITKRYCSNIEALKNSNIDKRYINILLDINDIVNCNSLEKLKFIYLTSPRIITDYKTIVLLESSIRGEYAKLYSNSLYRLNENHKLTNNSNLIENKEIMNILNKETYDDIHPNFYIMDGEFNLQIHVLGAYREYERPSNFKEDWNRPKFANHGICTSYISNNQIAAARQYHPMIGFYEYRGEDMLLCSPDDIGSQNYGFDSTNEKATCFLPPKYMINYSRHTHNEIVIERKKFTDDKLLKKQPSYVLLIVDNINNDYNFKKTYDISEREKMLEYKNLTETERMNKYKNERAKIYEETLQAAIDFNLPIVVVDRLKYAKLEREKCDNLLIEFEKNHNFDLLEQLFVNICNNAVGCFNYYNINLEYCELFNKDVLNSYFYKIIKIINSFSLDDKVVAYKMLIKIKENELKKLNTSVSIMDFYDMFKILFDENNLTNLLNIDHIIQNQFSSPIIDSTSDEEKYKELVNLVLSLDDNIKDEVYNDYQDGVIIEDIIKKIKNNEYGNKRR